MNKKLKALLLAIYLLCLYILILVLSAHDYEMLMMDDKSLTLCQAPYEDFYYGFATICFLFIAPSYIGFFKKNIPLIVLSITITAYWGWMFFGRFHICFGA